MINRIKPSLLYVFIALNSTYSCAITINGKELKTILKPDQVLVYTSPSSADNIYVSMKNGAIEIGSLQLTNNDDVINWFNTLEDQKDQLSCYRSEDIVDLKSGTSIVMSGGYVCGDNKIIAHAETAIDITDSIFRSKNINFICNELKTDACFLDTDVLQLEAHCEQSLCQILQFTFDKNIPLPGAIQGNANFEKNEIPNLLVVGARKLIIQFAPEAFN